MGRLRMLDLQRFGNSQVLHAPCSLHEHGYRRCSTTRHDTECRQGVKDPVSFIG